MAHGGPKSREMAQGGPFCKKTAHIGSFYSANMKREPELADLILSAQPEPLPLSSSVHVSLARGVGNAKWPMVGQNLGQWPRAGHFAEKRPILGHSALRT